MEIMQATLLSELIEQTQQIKIKAESWLNLSPQSLRIRPDETSWNVLECLEHLNKYGDFYLREIEQQLLAAKHPAQPQEIFKSGWLGNYSVNLMLPNRKKTTTMKAPKTMNPIHSDLPDSTLGRFIKQQASMLQLLEMAKKVSLRKNKTAISLSKFIRFRLGDTFRFVIYHNERHIAQAERVLAMQV